MTAPNLTRELLRHAQRLRQPGRLAMAFKSQNPDWGSQATLVSIGVSGYLHELDWDLTQVSARFPDWHEEARASHDPHLLLLRATQIHALSQLVSDPRAGRLRLTPKATQEQRLWHRLAQHGLLLHDAQHLAHQPLNSYEMHEWLPGLRRDTELLPLWELHHESLLHVALDDFLEAVHPDDQRDHPNVLFHTVVQHLRTLGHLADPFLGREVTKAPGPQRAPTLADLSPGSNRGLKA